MEGDRDTASSPAWMRGAARREKSRGGRSGTAPLSPDRYAVQFTASAELRRKLEHAKNLMSHANPSGDLAVVVERALDLLIEKLERQKLGRTNRPQKPRPAREGAVTRESRRAALFSRRITCRRERSAAAGSRKTSAGFATLTIGCTPSKRSGARPSRMRFTSASGSPSGRRSRSSVRRGRERSWGSANWASAKPRHAPRSNGSLPSSAGARWRRLHSQPKTDTPSFTQQPVGSFARRYGAVTCKKAQSPRARSWSSP
jgi:hypothetical protein